MYTVYVIDDEALILNEIVNNIRWLDNGFEVIGSSQLPTIAIKEITELRPHVVFTDLKMPEMSGVEMIKILKDNCVEFESVILSAFGSFEDSRNFFRMDGFDYLLKPMKQIEVQIVLERMSKKLLKKENKISRETDNINPSFKSLIQYLDENFNKKHTLESLSKQFGLNPNYICNLFSKHYVSTLTRHVTKLRMEHAIALMLRNETTPYKEIAIDCGYTDYYYFCKVFKEYYGDPPTAYMKTLKDLGTF